MNLIEEATETTTRTSHLVKSVSPINCDSCLAYLAAPPSCPSNVRNETYKVFEERMAPPSYLETHPTLKKKACNTIDLRTNTLDRPPPVRPPCQPCSSNQEASNKSYKLSCRFDFEPGQRKGQMRGVENIQCMLKEDRHGKKVRPKNVRFARETGGQCGDEGKRGSGTGMRAVDQQAHLYSLALQTVKERASRFKYPILNDPMLPGYGGHIPLEYKQLGKSFPVAAMLGVAEFENMLQMSSMKGSWRDKSRDNQSGCSDRTEMQLGKASRKSSELIRMFNESISNEIEPRNPYRMPNNDSRKYYIPGYGGHVPMTLNKSEPFAVMTHNALNEFTDGLKRRAREDADLTHRLQSVSNCKSTQDSMPSTTNNPAPCAN